MGHGIALTQQNARGATSSFSVSEHHNVAVVREKERRCGAGASHSEGKKQRETLAQRRQLGKALPILPLSLYDWAIGSVSSASQQLHTSELDDGLDWNKLNLRSVTEESQLDEFLRTAELAGTEFTAGEWT